MPASPAAAAPSRRDLLRSAGLRCTPAREAVLAHLARQARPLAHRELARARALAALDRVTLYRTRAALQEAGLVHRVRDQAGAWRFCAHVRRGERCPANHPHFLCTRCGRMRCLTGQTLPWITVRGGERITGKQLVVYGLCRGCRERGAR